MALVRDGVFAKRPTPPYGDTSAICFEYSVP
jgi:hypothetical protein